uniref:hypothetical protein n=1 Tax=Algoriphagus sp. PAP.12 TaxID=2996678 RepID=UPI00227A1F9D
FGFLGLVFSMFFSYAHAQSVVELSQFLGSSKAGELNIDQDYLFGRTPYGLLTSSKEKFPEGQGPRKIIAEGKAINKLNGSDKRFSNVELVQWKINELDEKTISVDPSKFNTMENLKVILILSSVPLSKSEVEQMFSRFTDSDLTILYQYSEPV